MEMADVVVVIAFTRFLVESAVEKPESQERETIANRRYPTISEPARSVDGLRVEATSPGDLSRKASIRRPC